MTTTAQESPLLDIDIEREAKAAPCPCGGYADENEPTKDEIEKHQTCGRKFACCLNAFVCRVCKKRFLVRLPAPEAY